MNDKIYHSGTDFEYFLNGINDDTFEEYAVSVFHYQYRENEIYRKYVDLLKVSSNSVNSIRSIPFIPIEFFKSNRIKTGGWGDTGHFLSSGTTDTHTSKHYIKDIKNYLHSSVKSFEYFYGPVSEYVFLALLPSYLERQGSSLITMLKHFTALGDSSYSGFYLNEFDELLKSYKRAVSMGKKVMIWGVSFALLDLAESHPESFSEAIIIETGGMKGRRKELIREELHSILSARLNCTNIHSEYGMTELFSQAYSLKKGQFRTPPWLKILTRDISDPLSLLGHNKTGCLNIIDLANADTCCFIATNDLGKTHENGTFEITGRLDNSDIRGCNLMIN